MQFKNIIFLLNNTSASVPIGLCVYLLKYDTQRRFSRIVQYCTEIFEGFFLFIILYLWIRKSRKSRHEHGPLQTVSTCGVEGLSYTCYKNIYYILYPYSYTNSKGIENRYYSRFCRTVRNASIQYYTTRRVIVPYAYF